MSQTPYKVVVTSQPITVAKLTNQPFITGPSNLKDLFDVAKNLNYTNGYVLTWNTSTQLFDLEFSNNSGGSGIGSNVWSLTFQTPPNNALTVNNKLSTTTIGNATVVLAANASGVGVVGVVSLNDTLTSTSTSQAATANVANALNTILIAEHTFSQAAYNQANNSSINPANAVITFGFSANSRGIMSQIAYANGSFANTGDASYSTFLLRNQSLSVSTINLSLNGANSTTNTYSSINQITLGSDNYVYSFHGYVTARDTINNNVKVWSLEGAIKRGLGQANTIYVGTPIINIIAADNGTNNWTTGLTIDSLNSCMIITGTGSVNKTNWVSKIDIVEVG